MCYWEIKNDFQLFELELSCTIFISQIPFHENKTLRIDFQPTDFGIASSKNNPIVSWYAQATFKKR